MRLLTAPCPACRHFLALVDNAQAIQHCACEACHVVLEVVRLTEAVHEVRRFVAQAGALEAEDYE